MFALNRGAKPNNVDFIQRINGLADRNEVKRYFFDANYLILGLGDVYLTAPCAVPADPRHRLLSSKYNPARTLPQREQWVLVVCTCVSTAWIHRRLSINWAYTTNLE